MNEREVQGLIQEVADAQRNFRIAEAELFIRPLEREWIAPRTAVVFGKLIAYLAADNAFNHADMRLTEDAFLGPKQNIAGLLIEYLHQKVDRASSSEEAFRLSRITGRVLLMTGAGL